jgi:hypothetical protein
VRHHTAVFMAGDRRGFRHWACQCSGRAELVLTSPDNHISFSCKQVRTMPLYCVVLVWRCWGRKGRVSGVNELELVPIKLRVA